jgi:hypothetical protein
LPWQGRCVQLLFQTRRFRCRNSACARKVFAERVPEVAFPRARETTRLRDIVGLVGTPWAACLAPGLPIFRVNTLRAQTEQSLVKERLLAMLSSFFGCLALLLVCVRLYGLMAYTVARRRGRSVCAWPAAPT